VGYRGTKRDQQESVHTYILHVNTVLLLLQPNLQLPL
jgi:hypothetical protein